VFLHGATRRNNQADGGQTKSSFDYEAENWARGTEAMELEEVFEEYAKTANEEVEKNVVFQPAKDFPGRKWVMLWEAWEYYKEYQRRTAYCCPDRFGMHIFKHFEGYGQMELVENMLASSSQTVSLWMYRLSLRLS
jgi:hypothetical protein